MEPDAALPARNTAEWKGADYSARAELSVRLGAGSRHSQADIVHLNNEMARLTQTDTSKGAVLRVLLSLANVATLNTKSDISSLSARFAKLSDNLRHLANAQLVNNCIICPQTNVEASLLFINTEIRTLFVRKCYVDVFKLLMDDMRNVNTKKTYAISGTPGIGKSFFFVYLLFRLVKDLSEEILPLKTKFIIYQDRDGFVQYDLVNLVAIKRTWDEASELIAAPDTLYIMDGDIKKPVTRIAGCVVLFISSPRSDHFNHFVNKDAATVWYFPVWTLEELESCRKLCYSILPAGPFNERYRVYGGVARYIFFKLIPQSEVTGTSTVSTFPLPKKMEAVLASADARKSMMSSGLVSDIFRDSHVLLQMVVGDDDRGEAYQFLHLDFASKYVKDELWKSFYSEMIGDLKAMVLGTPSHVSPHFFELYGHSVISSGGIRLDCRELVDGNQSTKSFKFEISTYDRISFTTDEIEGLGIITGYHEPADDKFPAIDSFSPQGMYQFTVAAEHPIRGVTTFSKVCKLFPSPSLYFVVPENRYTGFRWQKALQLKGNESANPIPNLKQYVLKLPVRYEKEWDRGNKRTD